MRRFFVSLLMFMVILSYSQVTMENVLVEIGTATWSSACANEAQIIEQMKADGYQISVINYHLNDPFSNIYANQRAGFYQIQNIPYPIIGGQAIAAGAYEDYVSAFHQSNNTPSSFTITATGEFFEDTLVLELGIFKVAAIESDTISLILALTESEINYEWQGSYILNHVERIMSPNAQGISLDFSESNYLEIEAQFLLEGEWNPENMELVSFIQNDTTKQILQCHSENVTAFAPLPVHAFFQVEDTMICRKDIITFENYSTGDVVNTHWYFEDGNPEESNDINPAVKYEESGVYQVKLVVSNSVSSDTLLLEDYIHVQELPELSFALLPEFCHNHVAYPLIEGQPEEGQYFGLFVDTGYFHPEAAGIGNHFVYFTYQDPVTLCSDTLGQEAFVDLCESVEDFEQEDFQMFITNDDQQVRVSFPFCKNVIVSGFSVFDLKGAMIYQLAKEPKNEEIIQFPIPSYNPCLIFRVHTAKGIQVFKYSLK
ncbi:MULTISPECIES: PKD domain-containing protein [unclassified Lentimicrobium]|uniref:PKD domain-containing protein n=1 Tax=unclassified Lentimicrobium TaxID=2677434 RepID=UPI001554F3BE|nr:MULTISPECIES: PKD domain-containing protein [unclassified Lentimicrobium]NPD46064.1 PKD domain-containing protein [Lentimicrobium sp. S6]NPD84968.1 PKD domain-containing protein [Lentimicrobium sp. L6]